MLNDEWSTTFVLNSYTLEADTVWHERWGCIELVPGHSFPLFAWPGVWWCPAHTTSLWFNGVASSVVQSWSAASPTERGAQIRMFRRKQEYFHLTLFFKCVWRHKHSVFWRSCSLGSQQLSRAPGPSPAFSLFLLEQSAPFISDSVSQNIPSEGTEWWAQALGTGLSASAQRHCVPAASGTPEEGLAGEQSWPSLAKPHAEPQDHCHRGWGRHKFNSNGRKAQHSPDVPVLWKSKIKNKKKSSQCIRSWMY